MITAELEKILKTGIPISEVMGIHDLKISGSELSLQIPIEPNLNHKQTMFGGSLYSACALACYGLFLAGLRQHSVPTNDIVISAGSMRYLAPVRQAALVKARWESDKDMEKFFRSLQTKKKARVLMRAQIFVGEINCAEFSGHFVAIA
jgi:thioesterase domain-containing protein